MWYQLCPGPAVPLACEWVHLHPEVKVTAMQVAARPHPCPAPSSPSRFIILANCLGVGLVPAAGPV